MHRVEWRPRALKELEGLPQKIRSKAIDVVAALAHSPRPDGCKQLRGVWEGYYRVEVGRGFRVIYSVHDGSLVVVVVKVGDRKDVY